jgi:hypothetical protein
MNKETRQVTPKEARLLDFIKGLEWGKVVVRVINGEPDMISHAMKDIKL